MKYQVRTKKKTANPLPKNANRRKELTNRYNRLVDDAPGMAEEYRHTEGNRQAQTQNPNGLGL